MGNNLGKRFDKSFADRNSGGAGRKGVLDWSQVDGNISFYKLKEGINKIDIVPYKVKTKNHPLVKSGDIEVGDMDYVLDIWVHKNVGPGDVDAVCLKKNYGKPCPICEQAEEYKKAGKTDEFKAYQAKRRVFYNVLDASKPDEGLKVLEQSHFRFEKELVEEARAGDEVAAFFDPDKGVTVKFRGAVETFMGKQTIGPKSFSFVSREADVAKLVKKAISFDELLVVHTADDLFALMNGVDDDEDEEDAPKPRKPPVEEDDDEEEEAPKPRARSKKEESEDEDEEPVPKKKPKPKDEDEDEEDAPKCPNGHKFGKDNDEFDDCEDCKLWKACARANK